MIIKSYKSTGKNRFHASLNVLFYKKSRISEHKIFVYNICIMLDQRRRPCADFVEMLYKCFVFTGVLSLL